ncbi:hypothetical protein GGX14DRAFT_678860 [Mycena pura]|uniref:Uncharacterized protein n=1 Tax=Mycena pura TaxID=153505 RepID=A0AAD6UY62_9AGAR|nr:hypothetical protein GGX14DRAFT_678860 [Mycena pura]
MTTDPDSWVGFGPYLEGVGPQQCGAAHDPLQHLGPRVRARAARMSLPFSLSRGEAGCGIVVPDAGYHTQEPIWLHCALRARPSPGQGFLRGGVRARVAAERGAPLSRRRARAGALRVRALPKIAPGPPSVACRSLLVHPSPRILCRRPAAWPPVVPLHAARCMLHALALPKIRRPPNAARVAWCPPPPAAFAQVPHGGRHIRRMCMQSYHTVPAAGPSPALGTRGRGGSAQAPLRHAAPTLVAGRARGRVAARAGLRGGSWCHRRRRLLQSSASFACTPSHIDEVDDMQRGVCVHICLFCLFPFWEERHSNGLQLPSTLCRAAAIKFPNRDSYLRRNLRNFIALPVRIDTLSLLAVDLHQCTSTLVLKVFSYSSRSALLCQCASTVSAVALAVPYESEFVVNPALDFAWSIKLILLSCDGNQLRDQLARTHQETCTFPMKILLTLQGL